jgi:hypothetical protein
MHRTTRRSLQASCVLLTSVVAVAWCQPNPVVSTTNGDVRGYWETMGSTSLAAFRGIPYAQPPVGPGGRFMPARALTSNWTGVLDATADKPECYQSNPPDPAQSEDCLYLNVFTTPAALASDTPTPVMLWIYGGGLMAGSVSVYGAVENLVALAGGDVIVVAVSYRVNAFGFLALEELAEVDPRGTSGNMGITVTCVSVFVVCCLLSVVCCLLSVVCCLLSVVCCLLSVVCCNQFITCASAKRPLEKRRLHFCSCTRWTACTCDCLYRTCKWPCYGCNETLFDLVVILREQSLARF